MSLSLRYASKAGAAASIFCLLVLSTLASAKDVKELQIGVKYKPESCEIQAHKGDRIKVHYRVSGNV
uniref:Peptidyl-prolyl cis-trans isomerase n=1 Tax=Rhizophora mucronata TaxID=61149 RepID=A0A2P2J2V1_RHIMU